MMAVLFAGLALAMTMIYLKKRTLAFAFLAISILFSILMFWHHATDTLQINW
jgi:hypothetical protein